MKTLHIHGKCWSSPTYGTTYFVFNIWVDGDHVHGSEQHSGYGDHYLTVAKHWLMANNYLPDLEKHLAGGSEPLWRYCERKGIKYVRYIDEVKREKDLV